MIYRWTTGRVFWLNIGCIRIYLWYVYCSKFINKGRKRGKNQQFVEFVRKIYEREENDVTKSLYFDNDIAEIGERWEFFIFFLILAMVLLKDERGKRKKKIVCILAMVEKKIISLFYLTFFNLSKILSCCSIYNTHIERNGVELSN